MFYSARLLALCTLTSLALFTGFFSLPVKQQQSPQLPVNVGDILQQNCIHCHPNNEIFRKVNPRNLERSKLYQRLITDNETDRMPQGGRLNPESIEIIRNWIVAGAEGAIALQPEPLMTDDNVIQKIAADLDAIRPRENSKFFRYIVLNHLYNSGANFTTVHFFERRLSHQVF